MTMAVTKTYKWTRYTLTGALLGLPLGLALLVDEVPRFIYAACSYYTYCDPQTFTVLAEPSEIALNETSRLEAFNAACPCSWQIQSQPGGWEVVAGPDCKATLMPVGTLGGEGQIYVRVTSGQCQDTILVTAVCCSFRLQASTDGGQTWHSDSLSISGQPGQQFDLAVRAVLTAASGETEAWSYSVKHDASALADGDLEVLQVTTVGTDTETILSPEDLLQTDVRLDAWGDNVGYVQGALINLAEAPPLPPSLDFVTAGACYRITVPSAGSHSVDIAFVDDLADGKPPIETLIVQEGQSLYPPVRNLTLTVQTDPAAPPGPACDIGGPWTN